MIALPQCDFRKSKPGDPCLSCANPHLQFLSPCTPPSFCSACQYRDGRPIAEPAQAIVATVPARIEAQRRATCAECSWWGIKTVQGICHSKFARCCHPKAGLPCVGGGGHDANPAHAKASCPLDTPAWGEFTPPTVDTKLAGIVIGSYYWADVVDLNIRTIRDTCGEVPILVSDDCSPGHPCGRHAGPQYGWLKEICERHKVRLSPNAVNIGHATGDLFAVRKGLVWAKENGLKYLVKFSQRMILTKPNWLAEAVAGFAASKAATGGTKGLTDVLILDVDRWLPIALAEIPAQHHPQHIWMEGHFTAMHDRHFSDWWQWPLVNVDRSTPHEGILWHNANPVEDYHALAAKYGIMLRDFSTCGSHELPKHNGG
jgi:hypothetical protein